MEQRVSLIKMMKNVSSKVELAEAVVRLHLCFHDIKLSATEISIMAYFIVYGVTQQTKTLIINSKICKNLANIKTIMVKLKRLELIYKDDLNGKVYVTKDLGFELTPTIGLYLKIGISA